MARPRTVSPEKNELIDLGKEMVEWVNMNDPFHLSQWYTIHKGYTYNQWKTFIQREEFIPYYEKALKTIGIKYLDKNSNVRDGISQRWQRSYFQDLTEREDKELDEASARSAKSNEGPQIDPEILEGFKSYMNQLKSIQDKSKNG